jgi:hypothetical protein
MTVRALEQMSVGGAVALAVAAIGAGTHAMDSQAGSVPARVVSAPVHVTHLCAEDDPCWTWSRMGNRRRGVIVDGRRRVVGPCGYAQLRVAGLLDAGNARLRGDAWALSHGCASGPVVPPSGTVEVR